MSNAGQAILGVAGAVVGFFVGGPTGAIYGFQLGYLAGTALFPTQLPHLQGPRLGEGQQTVSTVGQPIPWIFGTQAVGGNIIWASPIREVATTEDVGGKGAPEQSQTTYSYFRSFAILLCEGPIGGIRRIWANGKLVYDITAPEVPIEDLGDSAFANIVGQAIAQVAFNENIANKMTIYTGTEDQMPDPVIESFKGVGNVPAYRGYAYVVFDDVELKPEDGNRIPAQWKFEVYESGEDDSGHIILYSNEVLYPWSDGDDPINDLNHNAITRAAGGDSSATEVSSDDLTGITSVDTAKQALLELLSADQRQSFSVYLGHDCDTATTIPDGFSGERNGYTNRMGAPTAYQTEAISVGLHYNSYDTSKYILSRTGNTPDEDLDEYGVVRGSNGYAHINLPIGSNCGAAIHARINLAYGTADTTGADGTSFDCLPDLTDCLTYLNYNDMRIEVTRLCQPPPNPCDAPGAQSVGISGWVVANGQLLPCNDWELDESTTYRVLQAYEDHVDTNTVLKYPLNPVRPLGHNDYDNQEFWEEAYALEVARGRMAEGLSYGVDYPVTQGFGYKMSIASATVEVVPVSLASIVSRICQRVGLANYDVSDLEDKYVVGYQISRPMAARAGIEPLRQVGFFDVVESAIQLKFPTRGKAPVSTLADDDLGAHFVGEQRIPKLTTLKKLELELPRQIRVHFQNPERDYDPGEELSPVRYDTAAESVLDIDLAVAITPTKAAQVAEVLFRDTWAGRWAHGTSVDQTQSSIEPADCILVPADGSLVRMRVPALTDRLPNLRALELVRDDDGTYVSHAVGTESPSVIARTAIPSPVEVVLLDLPPLSSEHNDAGIYVAARPLIPDGLFRGVSIARSDSPSGAFELVGSVTDATPMGRVLTSVPSGPSSVFDEATTFRVELDYGEVESRDEEDVLNGANTAAVGANGRWEILQFKNATHITGRIYELSGFLRGRRGTEHYIGTSLAQDRFVMLTTGSVARIGLSIANVGAELSYRASPIGSPSVTSLTFAGYGVALKPFSPAHLSATRNADGDIAFSWVRRDRLASDTDELMSEAEEDYEVSILNSDDEVLRVISVSETEATYSADQQVTDFGSVQSSVLVRVAQVSVDVGAGSYVEAQL